MSGTPPITHRASLRRRLRDVICTLLCRPTLPPSPLPSPPYLPFGHEPRQNPPSGPALASIPVEAGSVVECNESGKPSTEGGSVQNPSAPGPSKDVAILAHGATDTVLDLTPTPSTPTDEVPVAPLPPSSSPSVKAPAPTNDTYVDDDDQVDTLPTHSLDSSPGDAHDHTSEIPQQHLANPASPASSIMFPNAPATPVVPDVEDSQPNINEQDSPLMNGETQRRLYMTNVVITLVAGSDKNTRPLHLTALCPLSVDESQEGECIRLEEISHQAWRLNESVVLPLGAHPMYLVVKDKDGNDIGFVYFEQEDVLHVQSSGDSVRPFVTHCSQLNLSMSWKIANDATQSPDLNFAQASAGDVLFGDLLDNPESDSAMLNHLLEGLVEGMRAQEDDTAIGTGQDYNSEGVRLFRRFESTGRLDDIDESIVAFQRAVEVTPKGNVNLHRLLSNLGNLFQTRFERTRKITDIEQAITYQQEAVRLSPEGHADLPALLKDMGNSFQTRFENTSDMTYMNQAITSQQEAVRLTPEGHADLPARLNNLCASLSRRFQHTGDMIDLTQAITSQQEAVRLTPEGHADLPALLHNLGGSFFCRFERTGDMSDITQVITCQQRAVQLTPGGHANLPILLNNMGSSFRSRFERTGSMTDITQAITSQQEALRLTPQDHALLPCILNSLGVSFESRFNCTGDMGDITQAITSQERAVQVTPKGHADLPVRLNSLGGSFLSRFDRTEDMTDINQAIVFLQQVVLLTPQGHAGLPARLSKLGISFFRRFKFTWDMADITQAINFQKQAVELAPVGDAGLPALLNNLGNSFLSYFKHTGNMSDITQAITSQQRAVQLTPKGHAELPAILNNLGTSFLTYFEHTGNVSYIIQAITSQQQAVDLTPEGHADLPGRLINLGTSFERRFSYANTNGIGEQQHVEDMHASVGCFRAATQGISGPPTVHLQGAMRWARLIKDHDPESHESLVPFEAAVKFLTLVAGLERTMQARHSQLRRVSWIVLEAAAAAFRLEHPDKAVEWLEQGRCFVWGQLNGLRTPMDDLQEKDPQLAQRLTDVAKQLEFAGSTRPSVDPSMEMSAKISLEEAARTHLALAEEWQELLSTSRRIPGFESFLLPSPCSTILQGLPETGPVVIINCHEDRCDALALLHDSDQPHHIPLPNFSLQKAIEYRGVLKNELQSKGIRMREEIGSLGEELGRMEGRDLTQGWHDETTAAGATVHGVLQSLWYEVAKPILDMLGYPRYNTSSDSVQPRIWWCPTGVMSFLPIHAAGIYGGTDSECVMDYVVSSYTPTVTAITARVKSSHSIDATVSGLFLTSQPKAPGAVEILGTTEEVDDVYAKALQKGMRALKREGDGISVEDCRRYMGEFSCVHLACHASQNASDPLQSRFRLHKGELSLRSIIQMDLKNADLAFLSACQTSTGEEKLSDEAVHLAAGMLAAGYRRVVATMWSISDTHAPSVAADFYNYLWDNQVDGTGNGLDASLSAHALHHAVQRLRGRLGDSERDLLTWIPYVHFGY